MEASRSSRTTPIAWLNSDDRPYQLADLLGFQVLLQPTVFLRRTAFEQAGPLDERLRLILDHEMWIRMAALGPLLHIPEFWAVERTHASAKTIAAAGDFVAEASRLLDRLRSDPRFTPSFQAHAPAIVAGFRVFAGRRWIDSGEPRRALHHLLRAFRLRPLSVARVWFKVVQAAGQALGLGGLFLGYRSARRRVLHRRIRIADESGLREPVAGAGSPR